MTAKKSYKFSLKNGRKYKHKLDTTTILIQSIKQNVLWALCIDTVMLLNLIHFKRPFKLKRAN